MSTANKAPIIAHISDLRIATSSQLSLNHRKYSQSHIADSAFNRNDISDSMQLYVRACITSGAKQQRDNPVQSLQIRYTLPTIGNDNQKVLHDRYLHRTSCQWSDTFTHKYKLQRRTSDKLSTTISITQRSTRGTMQEANNKISTLQTSLLSI